MVGCPAACCMLHVACASAMRWRAAVERGASQCGLLVRRERPAYGCRPSNTNGADLLKACRRYIRYGNLRSRGTYTKPHWLPFCGGCEKGGNVDCHCGTAHPTLCLQRYGRSTCATSRERVEPQWTRENVMLSSVPRTLPTSDVYYIQVHAFLVKGTMAAGHASRLGACSPGKNRTAVRQNQLTS